MPDTLNDLMDFAETSIRKNGYHAVSFRDVADALGVKSASVHYYFRHKEDLGEALIRRYSDSFFAAVDARVPKAASTKQRINAICQTYFDALKGSDTLCLCGILGAESAGLPESVQGEVSLFFQKNIEWVEAAFVSQETIRDPRRKAVAIISSLQGGMMLATNLRDTSVLQHVIHEILDGLDD